METIQAVLAALGPMDLRPQRRPVRAVSIGQKENVLWGVVGTNGVIAYRKLIQKILQDRAIQKNYTESDVSKVVNRELIDVRSGQARTDSKFVARVKRGLPVDRPEEYKVWRHVFGARFSKYKRLGGFVFQKTANMKKQFGGRARKMFSWESMFGEYVVRASVCCVSQNRAVELADELFTRLELLFAFLIGPSASGFYVRVLRPSSAHKIAYALRGSEGAEVVGNSLAGGEYELVDLETEFFKDPAVPRLFTLISQNQPGGLQGRLIRAIEWIGKGTIARSESEAIICYCTAMETVLVREKKAIVSPSIVSSLSEYCAYLLGGGYEQRKKIERHVKEVYRERSAVAHGGRNEVDSEALIVSRNLATELVIVLNNQVAKGMSSDEDLVEYIGREKYGQ